MSKERLHIAYCGDSVDNGSMDVNMLAPALLSIGDLVSEANNVLNHDGSKVRVYVTSNFEKGSFEIGLEVVHTLAEQVSIFLNALETYSAHDIMEELGLAATLSGVGMIQIIQWLHGRDITRVEKIGNNQVKVFVDEEEKIITIGALNLFRSLKTRKHIEGVMSPLKQEGVEAFEVRGLHHSTGTRVGRSEARFFDAPKHAGGEPCVERSTERMYVHISNVSFEENLKWRFSDGDTKFYADVEDSEFLDRVKSGDLSFTYGDILLVDMEREQTVAGGEIVDTKKRIVKVYQLIPRAKKMTLPMDARKN